MTYETILVGHEGGVTTITLNRPATLNALTPAMILELADALSEAGWRPETRVVVLAGAGRSFCAGNDIRETVEPGKARDLHHQLHKGYVRVTRALRDLPKPVIARIQGHAVGSGLDLALAADFRIASSDARFGAVFVRAGLGGGAAYLLPRVVGLTKATELLFTGDVIDAAEANRLGILNRMVAPEHLDGAVSELAARMADAPTKALGLIKAAVNAGLGADAEEGFHIQALANIQVVMTEDAAEGKRAFVEKRPPHFRGA